VTASRSCRGAALATLVVLVSTLSGAVAAPPASAAGDKPVQPVSWLAAGDSYSSGEGIAGTGEGTDTCAQSNLAFGPKAASILHTERGWTVSPLKFVACTGATVHEFYNGGAAADHSHGPQWTQAGAGKRLYDVISMSMGGNDIGFADILIGCLGNEAKTWVGIVGSAGPGHACALNFGKTHDPANDLKQRVDNLIAGASLTKASDYFGSKGEETLAGFYTEVARDDLTGRGDLVIVGYPQLFAPSNSWGDWRGGYCNMISASDADLLGKAARYLDKKMRDAVSQAAAQTGHHIDYVSRYDLFHSGGQSHELCNGQTEYLNGLSTGFWDGSLRPMHSFHPNEVGHQVTAEQVAGDVAAALPAAVAPSTAQVPVTQPPSPPVTSSSAPPITDGTSHWNKGDPFDMQCVVAWPTAPSYTSTAIEMTMSCPGVPQQFLFVSVTYPDPNLPITPGTGAVRVRGTIADFATSAYGFRELVVLANSVTWAGHGG
jgi:hypothetical protein